MTIDKYKLQIPSDPERDDFGLQPFVTDMWCNFLELIYVNISVLEADIFCTLVVKGTFFCSDC